MDGREAGRIHTGTLKPRTITVYLSETALDSFELEAGVGEVSGALPCTAQRMDVSCGAGSFTFDGSLRGVCVIEGVLGETEPRFPVE